ncbi:MAG TPA: cytidine deaminase, partial [Gemmatimonadaceae bacterium]|nr:cytidine deaminase [Gemmatimonadaceae bacterium]
LDGCRVSRCGQVVPSVDGPAMTGHASADARLRGAAEEAMTRAYAPYSGFRVGAALLTADGTIVAGCNVENASYPSGMCAERGAVAAAVALGHREFTHLVLVSEAEEPSPPCGFCRQVLVEFAPALQLTSRTTSGAEARWALADLLPHQFTPQSLHQT